MSVSVGVSKCSICDCAAFDACMLHVNECGIADNIKNEYAALDTMITSNKLPFFDFHKLKSVEPKSQLSCVNTSIHVQSSLLAVLGTYPNFSNIIHMGCPRGVNSETLFEMSAALQKNEQKGTSICVTIVNDDNNEEYRVAMCGSSVIHTVRSRDLVRVLCTVLEGGNSICWYWDHRLRWCIPALHGADKNMWVTLNHNKQPRCLELRRRWGFKDDAVLLLPL